MTNDPVTITEEESDDPTRVEVLAALTDGWPYVLLSATTGDEGGIRLAVDAGGDIQDQADVIKFLELALNTLKRP